MLKPIPLSFLSYLGRGKGTFFISALPKGETIWPLSQIVLPPLFEKLRIHLGIPSPDAVVVHSNYWFESRHLNEQKNDHDKCIQYTKRYVTTEVYAEEQYRRLMIFYARVVGLI